VASTPAKILVIDDENGIREGCRRVLQPAGFHVQGAATIREGLQKLQEDAFDLVLLDVMMPDGRGIDLLKPIREADPDTVCVIITGYATVELAVEAIKQGAYDFISKPFTSDHLLMTVNQGLEKRRLSLETKRLAEVERRAATLAHEKQEMERLDQQKSDFMRTVAHELRAPVAGAQSLVRTLLRGMSGDLTDQQKEILQRIEARQSQLMDLVNDLLSLAASKTFDQDEPLKPVSLIAEIQRVLDQFSVEVEKKCLVTSCTLPEKDVLVKASEDGLPKIFNNLVGNAVKYTPEGGQVEIEVIEGPDGVVCKIKDTGIGIPEQDLPHLGEEFFRARNARKSGVIGTGLGLSIVKQQLDRCGGKIEVQSEEGKGTTVTLHFQKNHDS
jgi:two-component system sensor histidine kinase/response regulator